MLKQPVLSNNDKITGTGGSTSVVSPGKRGIIWRNVSKQTNKIINRTIKQSSGYTSC